MHVLWEHHPRSREHAHGLAFTASRDGGEHFAPPALVPHIAGRALGANGSQQGMLTSKLAVGDDGAVAVVNSTFRRGDASHV